MSVTYVPAVPVWCRTCGARGMVNSKLGVRGTIEKCSACQKEEK